jgi:hypothetical protein
MTSGNYVSSSSPIDLHVVTMSLEGGEEGGLSNRAQAVTAFRHRCFSDCISGVGNLVNNTTSFNPQPCSYISSIARRIWQLLACISLLPRT